jgi:hypothetical protein
MGYRGPTLKPELLGAGERLSGRGVPPWWVIYNRAMLLNKAMGVTP